MLRECVARVAKLYHKRVINKYGPEYDAYWLNTVYNRAQTLDLVDAHDTPSSVDYFIFARSDVTYASPLPVPLCDDGKL